MATSKPFMVALPAVCAMAPVKILIVVVFPAPLWPNNAETCPGTNATDKLSDSRNAIWERFCKFSKDIDSMLFSGSGSQYRCLFYFALNIVIIVVMLTNALPSWETNNFS